MSFALAAIFAIAQAAPAAGDLALRSQARAPREVAPLVEQPAAPPVGVSEATWRMEGYRSFGEAAKAVEESGRMVRLPDRAWGYVPAAAAEGPVPLLVLLHGLGQDHKRFLRAMRPLADAWGFAIVAPRSRARTWDLLAGAPSTQGPLRKLRLDHAREDKDMPRVKTAILAMAKEAPLDARRIAVAGFSDGASYALTLGTGAPKLFSHVIVMSGGLAVMPDDAQGEGRKVFLSHGTSDAMLPFDEARDTMVPKLEEAGFDVHFRRFDGPHVLYYRIALEAVEDWLGSGRLARNVALEEVDEDLVE